MRLLTRGLLIAAAMFALPAVARAAEPGVTVSGTPPSAPTPFQAAVIGLTLTAVAVVGVRVAGKSSDTMMYSVLACLAVTAVMVAYTDRVHAAYVRAGLQRLQELQQQAAR
jgi:amino acid transporter